MLNRTDDRMPEVERLQDQVAAERQRLEQLESEHNSTYERLRGLESQLMDTQASMNQAQVMPHAQSSHQDAYVLCRLIVPGRNKRSSDMKTPRYQP